MRQSMECAEVSASMVSRKEIDDLVREEKKSSKLSRLEDNFYQEVHKLIKALKSELEGSKPGSAKYKILERDMGNTKNQLEKLFEFRTWKILRKSALQNDDKTDFGLANMTEEEKRMYHEIKNIINSYHNGIYEIINGKQSMPQPGIEENRGAKRKELEKKEIKKEMKEKTTEDTIKETQRDEYMVIRALQDIPGFRGIDMHDYTLKQDDVAAIPNTNAEALCKRKIAIKIEMIP